MFLVGQAAAKQMVAQVKAGKAPGAIVNMTSINAVVAIPNQVPYCAAKGGLAQLTKVMALSLAPYGIRVNANGPGSIMTHAARPHRRAGGGRRHRGFPGLKGCKLYHRGDDLPGWREARLELRRAGEGRGAGLEWRIADNGWAD